VHCGRKVPLDDGLCDSDAKSSSRPQSSGQDEGQGRRASTAHCDLRNSKVVTVFCCCSAEARTPTFLVSHRQSILPRSCHLRGLDCRRSTPAQRPDCAFFWKVGTNFSSICWRAAISAFFHANWNRFLHMISTGRFDLCLRTVTRGCKVRTSQSDFEG
jgi:hypothetical protein